MFIVSGWISEGPARAPKGVAQADAEFTSLAVASQLLDPSTVRRAMRWTVPGQRRSTSPLIRKVGRRVRRLLTA